jgi:adenylate kinase family enzyme
MAPPPLESFGRRIMVCGPSNSGKSTLAVALARRLGVSAIHLDQLRHLPNTDWVQRPDAEFQQLHDAAIRGDAWIVDGNYTRLMPQRIARATGIVLLGDNRWANFARYLRRTLFQKGRAGALGGDKDTLKWEMVRWILLPEPRNVARYRRELPATGLPFWESTSMRDLAGLYACWELSAG